GIVGNQEKSGDEEPADDVVNRNKDAEEDISHAPPGGGGFENSHGEEGEPEGLSNAGVSGGKEPVLAGSGRAGEMAEEPVPREERPVSADAAGEGSLLADPGWAGEMPGRINTGSDAAVADSSAAASDCAAGFGGKGIFCPARTQPIWQSRQIRGRCLKIFPPPRQL